MKKRIFLTVIGVLVVIGIIAGIKALQIKTMIDRGAKFAPPPAVVTAAVGHSETWEVTRTAVGSLVAVQGVTVASELAGKVVGISFEPGSMVQAGNLLVQLDVSAEQAQLRSAEATMALAKINVDRLGSLVGGGGVAQADFDNAAAAYKEAEAQADNIRAVIAKKTICAPFTGRLGIRLVNLGQILTEGQAVVSLQSLDPIFVNFLVPQQQLASIDLGFPVRVTTDALPGETVKGKITAINPEVDSATRNIMIQATLPNRDGRLRPGMYANVTVVLPTSNKVLAIPATAVLYAPYSDSVFVVEEKKDEKTGKTGKVLRQQFIQLGEKRGDFVAVTSGLKENEAVVSTGVFKYRNGQAVVVDNTLQPPFKLEPKPKDD